VELIEIGPGIDLEKDILNQMEFRPVIHETRPMDPRLFQESVMGIRNEFLLKELKTRVRYDEARNLLYLDFNGLEIDGSEDVENIRRLVEGLCRAAGKKVNAVVNYNAFKVNDKLLDEYLAMGEDIIQKYYRKVARHTASQEIIARFTDGFQGRKLAANLFASKEEAVKFVLE
jgi:propionate CoA-transferase